MAALKSLPVHHQKCRLYIPFSPLRSARIFLRDQSFVIGYPLNYVNIDSDIIRLETLNSSPPIQKATIQRHFLKDKSERELMLLIIC